MNRESGIHFPVDFDRNLNRRSLLRGAAGLTAVTLFNHSSETHAANAPEALKLSESPYETDWLGVNIRISMPKGWLPNEIEDYGIKKLLFEGVEHPEVSVYFESGEGISSELVANNRVKIIDLKRNEAEGITFVPVTIGDSNFGKYNGKSISALMPGDTLSELMMFSGCYFKIDESDHVLCAEMKTPGDPEIAGKDWQAFHAGVKTIHASQ